MITLFERLFGGTQEREARNIREGIRRDNLRAILSDPHWVRGEYVGEFERQQRRRHVLQTQTSAE